MGKKGKSKSSGGNALGRALLKDRFGPARSRHRSKDPSMVGLYFSIIILIFCKFIIII